MKNSIVQIFKNYKTSVPGFMILVLLVLYLIGKISQEQLETAVMFLTAFGFLGARDYKRYSGYKSRGNGGKFS